MAGEAALIKDVNAKLTPAQVLDLIQKTSDDVSAANRGARTIRVNQYRAVSGVTR